MARIRLSQKRFVEIVFGADFDVDSALTCTYATLVVSSLPLVFVAICFDGVLEFFFRISLHLLLILVKLILRSTVNVFL